MAPEPLRSRIVFPLDLIDWHAPPGRCQNGDSNEIVYSVKICLLAARAPCRRRGAPRSAASIVSVMAGIGNASLAGLALGGPGMRIGPPM